MPWNCTGSTHGEGAALPEGAVDGDGAAVQLDQALDEGEAEAGAAVGAAVRLEDLPELLEDDALVGGGDADAAVGDRQGEGG